MPRLRGAAVAVLQGASYAEVVTDMAEGLTLSLAFWRPSFRFGLWWPTELPSVDQYALAVSCMALVFEYGPSAWVGAFVRVYPLRPRNDFRARAVQREGSRVRVQEAAQADGQGVAACP